MHTVEIPTRGLVVEVPSEFNEMSSEQVQYVFMQYDKLLAEEQSLAEFRTKVLMNLLGCKVSLRTLRSRHRREALAERLVLLSDEFLGFLLTECDTGVVLNYDSPLQHLPYIRINGIDYSGYKSLLADITFGAFREAYSLLIQYITSQDITIAERVVSTLYGVPVMSKIDPWQRNLVVSWFGNCVKYIQNENIAIAGREVCFLPLFNHEVGRPSDSPDRASGVDPWRSLLFTIAESHVFGSVSDVDKTDLFDILLYTLNCYHNAKDQSYK